jgi:hypothetical protein
VEGRRTPEEGSEAKLVTELQQKVAEVERLTEELAS